MLAPCVRQGVYNRRVSDTQSSSLLEKVDFGRYDAESDPNLLDYFVVTGTAREAATGSQLVVGRKGSGKTALFKHLAATLEGRVVDLDLVDYVFAVHRGMVETGVAREFAFTASWRLLILSAMFSKVRDDLGRGDRKAGDEALGAIGLGSNGGALRAMADWLRRVRRVDLPSVEGLASMGGIELDSQAEVALDVNTANALATLENLVSSACKQQPVTVLIDRLDDAWDGSQESLHLITGGSKGDEATRFAPDPAWACASHHLSPHGSVGEVVLQ